MDGFKKIINKMSSVKIRLYGYILMIATLLLASSTPIAYKFASGISALELLFFVSLTGTVFSGVLVLVKGKQKNVVEYFTKPRQFAAMAIVGILTFTFLSFTLSYAAHYVSAAMIGIVYRTWPLMLIAIAPFIIREKITRWDALAVLVGFSGLFATLIGNTSISIPLVAIPFVVLLLLGAFGDAIASAVQKRYNYEMYSSLFAYNVISFAIFLPLTFYFHAIQLSGLSTTTLYAIAFLGVVQNVMLTFFFVVTLRTVKTSLLGNVLISAPFVTMMLGYALLGEPIEPYYIVIAVSVVIGVVIQRLAPKTTTYLSKNKDKSKRPGFLLYDVSSAFANTENAMIYDVLKGSGRALAFCKRIEGADQLAAHHKIVEEENKAAKNCIIFTNKMQNVKPPLNEEIAFIKDIMGYGDQDLLVVGVGDPEPVEKSLYNIYKFNGAT